MGRHLQSASQNAGISTAPVIRLPSYFRKPARAESKQSLTVGDDEMEDPDECSSDTTDEASSDFSLNVNAPYSEPGSLDSDDGASNNNIFADTGKAHFGNG